MTRERFFNTEGPIRAGLHYHVAPLERFDLPQVLGLIEQEKYFVLRAPRQTGKTTALLALMEELNRRGRHRCVYANVEIGQSAREDVGTAIQAILAELADEERNTHGDGVLAEIWQRALAEAGPHAALRLALGQWARACGKPLVVIFDEIDALVGDTLIAVLRQLRAGYRQRPGGYPQSVVLCGVRDVRDYRIYSTAQNALVLGGSAFNIRAESLRLGDFAEADVDALLAQHTAQTGQRFEAAAMQAVWNLTRGQPWLVNALAYEACFRNENGLDRTRPITEAAIQDAREELIERRETHLDQLAHKLEEPRVRRVIAPLLSGEEGWESIPADDIAYCRDLGLIGLGRPVEIANPIYREVVPRELTWSTQEMLSQETAWYTGNEGELRVDALLEAFQQFFREHADHWIERFEYKEAGPQLLLQAFLQRVVNSGGRIEREYGQGRRRTDLMIVWPTDTGSPLRQRRIVIECKLLRGALASTIRDGLAQTRAYMDICGTAEGHLVIFDRDPAKSWDEKVFRRRETADGAAITVWGV